MAGQAVLPDHDDSHAGRAEVLLGAAVHQVVGVPVDSPAQEVGAHVGHQGHANRRELGKTDPADGFVTGHVQEAGVVPHLDLVGGRHTREAPVGTRPGFVHRSHQLGVAEGLISPRPGIDVTGGVAVGQQVERDLGELERRPALQEQDGEVLGHGGQ